MTAAVPARAGTYAVTGAASGIGQATAELLRAHGHTVIGVDLHTTGHPDSEVIADLATAEGRSAAAAQVLDRAGGDLDGAVLAAGVGPVGGGGHPRLIAEVNYCGAVELLEQWRPALAAGRPGKAVVVSSNSTTTTPLVPARSVRALLAGDVEKSLRATRLFGPGRPAIVYAASKIALSRWVRRTAVLPLWAGEGIRLNAVAPGAVLTPLLQQQLDNPLEGKAVRKFPIPVGGFGEPGALARWACFMLTDAADFQCGSIVFVDGGTDALIRPDEWPRSVPARRLPGYLRTFLRGGPR
ncbi:SDR family oxidoreductase [Tomitella fengzijianii]|uniref:SDR family oxidoreductase n=1 Tax=Tomitella fengzijianii TaxID=2597660 RepID=A0A516WZQ7_9ACTN|nr:SDR family oxidoreductase [Tomitella fengzijianii]QDQ96295.1 SDR family oxidoreductase [Tomitella fengzijianii]